MAAHLKLTTDPDTAANASPAASRCPRCRYPLIGLPANHVCPECGLRYDEDSLIWYVAPSASRAIRVAVLGISSILLGSWPVTNLAFSTNLAHRLRMALQITYAVIGVTLASMIYRSGRVAVQGRIVAVLPEGIYLINSCSGGSRLWRPDLWRGSSALIKWTEIEEIDFGASAPADARLRTSNREFTLAGVFGDFAHLSAFVRAARERLVEHAAREDAEKP